jgi:hypothetical protein
MECTITVDDTTQANTYIEGQVVRLFIPYPYGMFQANNLQGKILSNVGSVITLDIDSRGFDEFTVPAAGQLQPASMAPAGSRNLEFSNETRKVPFQSLNNRGN